jgi:hypothetical protein
MLLLASCQPQCLESCAYATILFFVHDVQGAALPEARIAANGVDDVTETGANKYSWCIPSVKPTCTHGIMAIPGAAQFVDNHRYIPYATIPVDLTFSLVGYASKSYSTALHVDECSHIVPIYLDVVLAPATGTSEVHDRGPLSYCVQ